MKKEPLRFNSWTLGGHGADLFGKSAEALELERMNPLRGVDEWRLGQIFDDARDGVFADLAWLYNEIEGVEPALMACCDARESAAGELGWVVRTADPNRTRGFDESLAGEQRDALLAEFGAVADDIPDLAGHMVSAFFRGAAHALPLWNADGSLAGFRHLDLWNFALDRGTGVWYWNADASRDEGTFQPVPPGETVSLAVLSSRHVDHAALPIFIRAALGAKRYGVWLDRFGIPPVAVIMPPNAERGEQGAYMDLARKFARGGSGVLPNGSQVAYGTEARSVCPFPEFIRFQQQQIFAVGLGRVQSGENQGDNLGGNAAGVVDSALRRIVRRDARRIARAVNDCVTRRVLERLFPGRPALARFDFDTDPRRTGREALEDAVIARNAGLAIDRAQLEEMTGYTLADAPEPANPDGFAGSGRALNSRNPSSGVAKALQNARKGEGATDIHQSAAERSTALLRDFAADMAPAAKRIKSILDMFDGVERGTGNGEQGTDEAMAAVRKEARKLAAELPDLMPDDPAMAAALEEAMAEAFAEGAGTQPPSVVRNAGTSEGAKKGWDTRRRNGWSMEQLKDNKRKTSQMVEEVLAGEPGRAVELGTIGKECAADIRRANPDFGDVENVTQAITPEFIRHLRNYHMGDKEVMQGHIPLTKEDLKKFPDVLADYDDIGPGSPVSGTGEPTVRYSKRFGRETIIYCEVCLVNSYGEKRLESKTAWKMPAPEKK